MSDGANLNARDNLPNLWPIPEELAHLTDGDIIRISPSPGELWVMYRRHSLHNSMLPPANWEARVGGFERAPVIQPGS